MALASLEKNSTLNIQRPRSRWPRARSELDRGDHVIQQVALEVRKRGRSGVNVAFRPVVLLRPAVGPHEDHRFGFAVRNQVVEQHVRPQHDRPLFSKTRGIIEFLEFPAWVGRQKSLSAWQEKVCVLAAICR